MELIYQSIFKSPKTTVVSLIGALVWLAGHFGFVITAEQANAFTVVTMFVIGFFAKDADSSHTQDE